jgi:hypothetical protein
VRELRYADNSQSVSQQTGSSGRLRRKTGRVWRTRNFAASQSKNRLPHLGEFAGVFRKIVNQSRRSKSRVKRGRTAHLPVAHGTMCARGQAGAFTHRSRTILKTQRA